MKIAILTLPLHTNYGGILQAYALQTVLEGMGHEVVLIRKKDPEPFDIFKHPYRLLRRTAKKILRWRTTDFFIEKHRFESYIERTTDARNFINDNIRSQYFDSWSEIGDWGLDAIVVGSDQIWRPLCFGQAISHAFLDFAEGMDIRRVAYAASFGTDKWEYSEEQTAVCRGLLAEFDAVSVRERSAVSLCEKYLGVRPEFVLDPTLLLDESDYLKFLPSDSSFVGGRVFKYVLDRTAEADAIAMSFESQGRQVVSMVSSDCVFDRNSRQKPAPVGEWLGAIRSSEFVLTDSYHCVIFSILFRKKVIILQNSWRGNTRLKSLLSILGLSERVIVSLDDYQQKRTLLSGDLDWDEIESRLNNFRALSRVFLKNSIS